MGTVNQTDRLKKKLHPLEVDRTRRIFPEPLRKVGAFLHKPSLHQSALGLKNIVRPECGRDYIGLIYLKD